jgi:hypothetical protein
MKEVHATEETVGWVEYIRVKVPLRNIRSKLGRRPSSMNRWSRLWGVPSMATTTARGPSLLSFYDGPYRLTK